ncbi:MAG: hypothetical protein NT074_02760 [Methanomicrobiales archaeon]|nr:hypothetical protein [Methanomicrobiales archaeon]
MLLACISLGGGSSAATPEEINKAIEGGLAFLYSNQNADGSFGSSLDLDYKVSATAEAVHAFEDEGYLPGGVSNYSHAVEKGLDFVLKNAVMKDVSGGDDSNGNSKMVYFGGTRHLTYVTGIVLPAIISSNSPDRVVNVSGSAVNGMTYREVAADVVDFYVTT